jgi:hypothetical protein
MAKPAAQSLQHCRPPFSASLTAQGKPLVRQRETAGEPAYVFLAAALCLLSDPECANQGAFA